MRGPLESRYLKVHPGATTGLDLCRYFEAHPNRWFTHAELKAALGCSDRIIREHVPEALNDGRNELLDVDRSGKAWLYRLAIGENRSAVREGGPARPVPNGRRR